MKDSFLYLRQFITALEDLEPEDRYRATYVLCYYSLNKEFPPEATAIDKMYVKTNMRLLEGQDIYLQKQSERGLKGGRPSTVTDEEIWAAYNTLYEQNGGYPSEQEVINYLGVGLKRIATRKAWKERNEHLTGSKEHEPVQPQSLNYLDF